MKIFLTACVFCLGLIFAATANAQDPAWATGPYAWSQGKAFKQMESTQTHVCILTKVTGDFDGGGEEVKVFQASGYWYLGGKSQQTGVGGQAYCFAKDKFLANGPLRINSDDGIWKMAKAGSNCFSAQGDAWWGDATTMLSGISGELRKSGDKAVIKLSSGPFTPSILRVDTCKEDNSSNGYLKAYAHSFFAGTGSSGKLAKYWGSEYVADSGKKCVDGLGDYEVPMAPVNDAMCHFTWIGGGDNWSGGAEYVRIYPKYDGNIERWFLRAHAGGCGNDHRTVAHAFCYKRDQR